MSREIKFRAWDKINKVMVKIARLDILDGMAYTHLFNSSPLDFWNDVILEQFTGLCDKNGVEIYEGDIIKIHNIGYANRGVIAKVEYNDGCSDLVGDNWRDYLKCYTCNHAVTVIGNIYENPDLLEATT